MNEFYCNTYDQTLLMKMDSDGAYQIFEKDMLILRNCARERDMENISA